MKKLTPSENLQLRIAELKVEKEIQEQDLSASLEAIKDGLNPFSIARSGLQNLIVNPEARAGATGTALNFGARFLAFKVLKRFGGVYGAAAAAVVGNLSNQYVQKSSPKVLKALGNLFKKKKRLNSAEVEEIQMDV